jgi:hypothetical protein
VAASGARRRGTNAAAGGRDVPLAEAAPAPG